MTTFINPYSKAAKAATKAAALQKNKILNKYYFKEIDSHNIVAGTMGIQSTLREGSVRKCLKRGTKKKYKFDHSLQRAINGGLGFDSLFHSLVCKAKAAQKQKKSGVLIPSHLYCSLLLTLILKTADKTV